MRRELLLTRLDVTVQSFKWADRLKSSNQEIATIYQTQRRQLSSKPGVKLFMLLSARDGLLLVYTVLIANFLLIFSNRSL